MELFRLVGKIAIDNSKANSAINATTSNVEKSEGRMSKAFKRVAVAAAAAFTVDKIVGFGKACISAYADFEQLTGGVETLFKTSNDKVMQYANNAYKTAGLSANQYMETVTSFSASLLQSLGGDTEKAADVADRAITDMADNANKMGTSMDMIQNAYQGFAKQNYTMLDNLKLGYGGTQEEMKRLLADATALSGVEYDISSYADIVEAIHVVQTEMGITGTTALEASTTIQGSVASMKSAWQNLLVGITAGNQDLTQLVGNFVTSLTTVANNLIPRIGTIFISVGKLILNDLSTGIKNNLPSLIARAGEVITKFSEAIKNNLPQIIAKGFDLIINLVSGILKGLPKLVAQAPTIVANLIQGIGSSQGKIMQKGLELMGVLVKGVVSAIPSIVKAAIDVGVNLVKGVWSGISSVKDWVLSKIRGFGSSILEGIKDIFGIHSPSKETEEDGKMLALGLVKGIEENAEYAQKSAEEMAQLVLDEADKTLEEYKKIHDMSAAEEASYWREIVRTTKEGTEARTKAEEKYYQALDSYKQQYKDYVDSIMNQTSLFSEFTKKEKVKGTELVKNLQSQISGMAEYYKTIESLQGKIGGTKLFESLAEMGMDSLAELQAVNEMSESQLEKYVELYDKKYEMASKAAVDKLGKVQETVDETTGESNKVADTNLKKLVQIFSTNTEKISSDTTQKFTQVVNTIESKMKAAVAAVKKAVAEMNAAVAGSGSVGVSASVGTSNVSAHASGGILTKPTIFGYTPATNTYHLGGEAGAEAIAPIDTLQGYVKAAVASEMSGGIATMISLLEKLVDKDTSVYLNSKEISKAVNRDLGVVY